MYSSIEKGDSPIRRGDIIAWLAEARQLLMSGSLYYNTILP